MSESILETVKGMSGPSASYDVFDEDYISLINSCLATLFQCGAGQDQFTIKGASETWDDFSQDKFIQAWAKDYIRLYIKISWDPDTAAFVTASREKILEEIKSRVIYYCTTHK